MSSVRISPDILKPGMTYQWRVRIADGSNWNELNNRSQSRWVKFTRNQSIKACNYRYDTPVRMDGDWEVSTIEKEGIDTEKINALMLDLLNSEIKDIHSVLIIKNGKLVLEEYFSGYTHRMLHDLVSVSKSITSILIGIAIDQKKISSIDNKIHDYFSSYKDINWKGNKKEISIKHVLSMAAGLDWNAWDYPHKDMRNSTTAMARSDDWIEFTLRKHAIDKPGKKFVYNNGLTMLLGEILKTATGYYADEFAEEFLFGPLGITDYRWKKLHGGTINTAWGLELTPRDMAKIGYMILKDGKWRGSRIVSSTWVRESTKRI